MNAMVGGSERPDMMIVVGGFNSSNTSHLQEIPESAGVPSFWVNSAACIDVCRNHITHKTAHGDMVVRFFWLTTPPAMHKPSLVTARQPLSDILEVIFRVQGFQLLSTHFPSLLLLLCRGPSTIAHHPMGNSALHVLDLSLRRSLQPTSQD